MMSFYNGIIFFIILILGLIPAIIIGIREKSLKVYISIFSLVMIYLVYRENKIELLYLTLYILLQWNIIMLYQWSLRVYGQSKKIFYCAIIASLLPLIISKVGGLIGSNIFSFLGISYITFKILQIIIESHDGIIVKSHIVPTLNFLLFFPSISSGPIDRSKRFEEDFYSIRSKTEYLGLLQEGIWKILLGCMYKFVLSDLLYKLLILIDDKNKILYMILYAYVYGAYMFFDFAGYSLMAVGTGYCLGVKIPDNFNKPFISKDIKEFWNRWHITLSHWFRDFIFSRFMVSVIRNKRFKKRINAASAGYIINMFIMGVWHGLSVSYIIYGLYHGILLAITERTQKAKLYKQLKNKLWFKLLSWFITLNLVMFGFFIFSGQFTRMIKLALELIH